MISRMFTAVLANDLSKSRSGFLSGKSLVHFDD